MMLICQTCHYTFKSDRKDRKCCSRRCANLGRRRRITRWCQCCNRPFEVKRSERHQLFCSRLCQGVSKRKCKRPSPEQLKHLVEHMTSDKVGELLGVSGTLIRKWAKEYAVQVPRTKLVERNSKPRRRL